MNNTYFYKDLPYVDDIKDITNERLFKDVPVDWYVLVSDIKNSTIAIEEGRYKDVNFIGACAITAVLNIDKQIDFPFVFGGDGATILIPPEYLEKASDALRDTQRFSEREFNLHMRIGAVPVIDVLRARYTIKMLKLKVAENYYQSIFIGGGLEQAEYLLKNNRKYAIRKRKPKYKADYFGLQCMWQDIPSKQDEVVSLLIKATGYTKKHTETYKEVMDEISDIYGTKEKRFPVDKRSIKIRSSMQRVHLESLLEAYQFNKNKKLTFWKNYFKTVWSAVTKAFSSGINVLTFKAYKNTVIHSIDSEKFDDMLRMVISGTKEQRHRLIGFLEEKYQRGDIAYGIHTTKSVYMTCLIFERKGKQVHFIDGANAGYTTAAKEFKNRIKWQKIYMQTV